MISVRRRILEFDLDEIKLQHGQNLEFLFDEFFQTLPDDVFRLSLADRAVVAARLTCCASRLAKIW